MRNLKTITFLFFLLFSTSPVFSQVEINELEEDSLVTEELVLSEDTADIDFSKQLFIKEPYQLPAYELYNKEWYTEHIKIKALPVPFEKDQIKIVLLQNDSKFVYPCKGKVCSNYGYRNKRAHTGTDIKLNLNDTVVSCFDGVVRMAKVYSGYGKIVVIRHFNGLETAYAHLNSIKVKPGQVVQAGQLIGLAGRTGRATTEHLHFEVRFLYEHFNPNKMLDLVNRKLLSDTLVLKRSDFGMKGLSSPAPKPETPKQDTVTKATTGVSLQETPRQETPVKTETQNNQQVDYHIIKKGDTLYQVSRKYGVSVERLMKLNNLKEGAILSIGQKIKLK